MSNFQVSKGGSGVASVKWFADDDTEVPDPATTFASGDAATLGVSAGADAQNATISGLADGTSVPLTVTSGNGIVATQADGSATNFDIVEAVKAIVRGVVSFVANASLKR